MPTFDTPEPILVTMTLVVGQARITATDRRDTVVEVTPSDATRQADVTAAQRTRVQYSDGVLEVTAPKQWRQYTPFSDTGSIDVVIGVPAGSRVHGDAGMADFHGEGRLGDCRVTTGTGDIRLDRTGPLRLRTALGNVTVDRAAGPTEVTAVGKLRIREIGGAAVLKNVNGETWVGEVSGDLRCNGANGDITIDAAHAGVDAKTANGNVRIGEVRHGCVVLKTASGELEVGIAHGTAALLDVRSQFGIVRNSLTAAGGPERSDNTVDVRARTSYGDIVIRRA